MKYKIIRKGNYGFIYPIPIGKLRSVLINNLSYKNNWFPNMPEWAKVTKLYKEKKGCFRWGLIYRVKKILNAWKEYSKEDFIIEDIYQKVEYENIENLRYYQNEANKKFLHYGLGIFELPCGSGKTKTTTELIIFLKVKTLVVVHTKDLVSQWESYKCKYLDVTTYQKAIRNLENIKNYDFIVYDECHLCKCKSIKKIALYSKAIYTLGLSASPSREDGHDMQIEEVCGTVLYKKTTRSLIDEGFLCDAKIKLYNVKTFNNFFETYREVYQDNIVDNQERNDIIFDIVKLHKNEKTLILVDLIEHGEYLFKEIEKINKKVIFFHGNIKNRKKEYEKVLNQEYDIIISTQIFDTGIDFPFLQNLILACGGKSAIKIIQRIGRLLRLYEGKKYAYIYDFIDNAKMLKKHSKIRIDYYNDTKFEIEEMS